MNRIPLNPTIHRRALERDNYKCRRCGEKANMVHHVQPKSNGGSDELSNLLTLCKPCHMKTHDLPTYKFLDDDAIEGVSKSAGNSAHVMVPKDWLNKTVVVRLK